MPAIKTPDQRVRVFISSTIQELADERKAVTDAVSKLHLIPVLFELGARPHPPRELYRAYLDQSHIFVGLYWNSYGWIAPGMQISGLEDEYRRSEGKPRLIYVKQTENRQPQLQQLLSDIEKSDTACYRFFSTVQELSELVEHDLALLLSERFEANPAQASEPVSKKQPLPVIRSLLLGRENEMARLKEMISQPEICLITLIGTGGTGKTRLSIHLANEVKASFRDGVYYVSLAPVTDAGLVAATIAHEIGLFDTGKQSIEDTLLEYLSDKNCLLVLDNFEQVASAAPVVARMMERCPSIKIIVTSRMPVHVREEHVVAIAPLANPGVQKNLTQNELLRYPSVELFLQRAREVNPQLNVNEENLAAIGEICHKLDGLPLAIELAAARAKFFPPVALLQRMGKALDFLSHGPKDLPQRQQTLRATIDWSYNLLDEDARKFFCRLAVFREGWTLEAAEAVGNYKGDLQGDATLCTEKLVDLGLFRIFSHYNENDAAVEPRFTMLQTVLEYALDKLQESGEEAAAKNAHAGYFVQLVEETYPYLWRGKPEPWLDRLEREFQNIRSAFYTKASAGNTPDCIRFIGALCVFWFTRGRINEGTEWLKTAEINTPELMEKWEAITEPVILARAMMSAGVLDIIVNNYATGVTFHKRAVQLFTDEKDFRHLARCLTFLGVGGLSSGDFESAARFREAIELGKEHNDLFPAVTASAFFWEVLNFEKKYDEAKKLFEEAEELCAQHDFNTGLAMILGQKGSYYLMLEDYENAEAALSKGIELFILTSQVPIKGWAYLSLSWCQTAQGKLPEALKSLQGGMNSAREIGDYSMMMISVLLGYTAYFMKKGDCHTAARLAGAAEAAMLAIHYAPWAIDRKVIAWVEEEGCRGIAVEDFVREKEAGKRITLEKAIALAVAATAQAQVERA